MVIENPFALQYLLADDIYLLKDEKAGYNQKTLPAEEQPAPVVETIPAIETPKPVFNYSGGNGKAFLILVDYPAHDLMDDSHLTALTNALSKRELLMTDVAIFNVAKHNYPDYLSVADYFKPLKVLFLGAKTLITGLPALPLNRHHQLGNSTVLYSFSFGEMMGNRDNTKAFWEQMKNL